MSRGTDAATKTFKSPRSKVIRFLQDSRDGWKEKALNAKREEKKAWNQARAVDKSRKHWKELARQQRRRVKELEGEVEKLKSFTAAVATAGGR